MGAAAFYSNFVFQREATEYFSTAAAAKPLLHTWSLSIEEQFYLIFPLYLLLITRFIPKQRLTVTLIVAALSIMLNVIRIYKHPVDVFFQPQTRAWELALGALLAFGVFKSPSKTATANAVFMIGLGCIAFAVFVYTDRTVYPGINAIIPTAGAAMCIWAGADTSLKRLLANPLMIFVGKISYSLYLWHFVLLAFTAYLTVQGLSFSESALLVSLAFPLAIGSWRYIERPFRDRKHPILGRSSLFAVSATAIAAFFCYGAFTFATDGIAGHDHLPLFTAAENAIAPPIKSCLSFEFDDPRTSPCPIGNIHAGPQFVLWGDSHADRMRFSIADALSASNNEITGGLLIGAHACLPSLKIDISTNTYCRDVNENLFAYVRDMPSISTVILAARWAFYSEGVDVDGRHLLAVLGDDATSYRMVLPTSNRAEVISHNRPLFVEGLERLVKALRESKKNVWIVESVPELSFDPLRLIYLKKLGIPISISDISLWDFERRQTFINATIRSLAARYGVGIIRPSDNMCRDGKCVYVAGEKLLYTDSNHLSRAGANRIASIFAAPFR